jgi:hypothetical protein
VPGVGVEVVPGVVTGECKPLGGVVSCWACWVGRVAGGRKVLALGSVMACWVGVVTGGRKALGNVVACWVGVMTSGGGEGKTLPMGAWVPGVVACWVGVVVGIVTGGGKAFPMSAS